MVLSEVKSIRDIESKYWRELADEAVLSLTNNGDFYRKAYPVVTELVVLTAPSLLSYDKLRGIVWDYLSAEYPNLNRVPCSDRGTWLTLVTRLIYENYGPDIARHRGLELTPFKELRCGQNSLIKSELERIDDVFKIQSQASARGTEFELTQSYVDSLATNKGKSWSDTDRRKVFSMWKEGHSIFEICLTLGRTLSSIGTILCDNGFNPYSSNDVHMRYSFDKWVNPNKRVRKKEDFAHLKRGDFVILSRKIEKNADNREVVWAPSGSMDRLIGHMVEIVKLDEVEIQFKAQNGEEWWALYECFELYEPEHAKLKREIDEHCSKAQQHFDKVAQSMQEIKSQSTKETQTMSIFAEIKSAKKGVEKLINSVTEDQVFEEILRIEAEIAKYKQAKTKVKAIEAKINALEAELAELVKFSDERFAGATA